jgi:ATP-dependent Lon protease
MLTPQSLTAILPLRNTVLFPGLSQVIKVGRPRSIAALKYAESHGFWIAAVAQRAPEGTDEHSGENIEPHRLYSMGTLCRVETMKGSDENGYQVVLRGISRISLSEIRFDSGSQCLMGTADERPDQVGINEATQKVLLGSLQDLSLKILKLIPANTDQLAELVKGVEDLPYLTHLCAGNIELEIAKKQSLLEAFDLKDRCLLLLTIMKELKESLELQAEIRGKMNEKLGQAQRQTILREQLRAIRDELGEGEESAESKYHRKIDEAGLPEDVRKVAEQELSRLKDINPQSPENHIIRNYLDLLTSLPWNQRTQAQEISLEKAKEVLAQDHFGLEKVKARIIQQLAVLKLKKDIRGTVLLFVGPPGIGKTSLGQSIAKALGRKFVRVSVGGVRDDAEIRGHRRTYVGAMPGRIVQGIKKAEVKNPVFLLDEIDKLSRAFNGDPASALLEVLDPEQNSHFLDHYLDVGFDLSEVLFIATANQLDTIPGPLLDRMEIIEMTGYTSAEKFHIAKNHLIPRALKDLGLESQQVAISDELLLRVITHYTREAGVRDLQRKLAGLFRGVSEKVVAELEGNRSFPIKVTEEMLTEILGTEKFTLQIADFITPPGVATGMAWSPVGGDILSIETSGSNGTGQLLITGQLGDVMKESAQIALTLLKSLSPNLHLTKDIGKTDVHIHVPAGAIPKDGPSAGVTLLCSLVSYFTQIPLKSRLAMTGEITLLGKVLPVGGIKEKVIAAHRAGILEIALPKKNEKDLREIPREILEGLKIHWVENVTEILQLALNLDVGLGVGLRSENAVVTRDKKDLVTDQKMS